MKGSAMTTEVVEPYAQALMSVAQTHNLTEQIGADVGALLNLLGNSEELRNFIVNPVVKPENKKAVLQQVLGESINPFLRNFLLLLVDRRRIVLLEGICQQYLALLRQLNQTVLAEVISAVELTESQQQAVRDKVTAMTHAARVELETKLAPELIGGVIIKVGSQVVDASLRGQLRRLSLSLAQ
ncbi:MAG: F0F1 ATP synthase subunit delta [Chroococcidiopsidaceae cyanobacterium CP_BM_RX_35]|nr:F0F1 ATP synthase subunit delta [Chroococcidiopsidaceae cyanobacterium CP_BM_RX_35]